MSKYYEPIQALGNKKNITSIIAKAIKAGDVRKTDKDLQQSTRRVLFALPEYFRVHCIVCCKEDEAILKRGYCSGCEYMPHNTKIKPSTRSKHYKQKIISRLIELRNNYRLAYAPTLDTYELNDWWKSHWWVLIRAIHLNQYPECQICGVTSPISVSNIKPIVFTVKRKVVLSKDWLLRTHKNNLVTICTTCKKEGFDIKKLTSS